ncbi:HK97 family phage prohead protease [Jannaschia sp. W003]|uniref:HK97 family phage prohead protease n=1 Tax=Jannaschia sp. W003 TaxID=2867012 RepID=UPI0021A9524C|nr:HK97 family phage prohead protease [Jannaschia sp. W003]UWQ21009.1 HK97 family phage prohead protease [Jannaschia sp. W003]
MEGLERKAAAAEALRLEEGARISGYASLFGVEDDGRDVVEPGAYCDCLARLHAEGGRVRMLWQHDPSRVIGVWDEVREDGRGLFVRGRLLRDVALGREAAALVEAGALDGLSIGYRVKRATRDAEGRRRLHELELWEVSLVTFPMLPDARVGRKARARDLARALREARRELAAL